MWPWISFYNHPFCVMLFFCGLRPEHMTWPNEVACAWVAWHNLVFVYVRAWQLIVGNLLALNCRGFTIKLSLASIADSAIALPKDSCTWDFKCCAGYAIKLSEVMNGCVSSHWRLSELVFVGPLKRNISKIEHDQVSKQTCPYNLYCMKWM